MTNEEAKIIIGNIPIKSEVLDDCYDITEYQEAKAMAIKALEQTRPNGTWKEWDKTFGRNIYYCTACGRSIEILYKYDFCPLCGADMRGDSE